MSNTVQKLYIEGLHAWCKPSIHFLAFSENHLNKKNHAFKPKFKLLFPRRSYSVETKQTERGLKSNSVTNQQPGKLSGCNKKGTTILKPAQLPSKKTELNRLPMGGAGAQVGGLNAKADYKPKSTEHKGYTPRNPSVSSGAPYSKSEVQPNQGAFWTEQKHMVQKTPYSSNSLKQDSTAPFYYQAKGFGGGKHSGRPDLFHEVKKRAAVTPNKPSQSPQPGSFCIVHVKKTKNNTHASISTLFGSQKTLWSFSGGKVNPGSTTGRRKSHYTQRMIFQATVKKLLALGFKNLVIHVRGPTLSKRYIFKNFYRRFRIIMLKEIVGIAHNGCRPPKARRV